MRWLLILFLVLPGALHAQDGPQLTVDFPKDEAIPGQPLSLRLTVLVPTFMPKPPIWPGFEMPNLQVRLPEGSTTPTSKRIGGETWAGITRHYRLVPMVPGAYDIPPQELTVTWRDATGGGETRTVLKTDPLHFTGVLPEGAEGLDPFIAASDLTLKQEVEGDPGALVAGNSFSRTVVADLKGLAPMFLPALQPVVQIPGLAAYAETPVLGETDTRGVVGGSRSETVTFVAEGGGSGQLPEIALRWYDLDDGTVKTARADAVNVAISGPPSGAGAAPLPRRIAVPAAVGLSVFAVVVWILRRLVPLLRAFLVRRRVQVRASEAYAWRQVRHMLSGGSTSDLRANLEIWARRVEGPDPRQSAEVEAALLALGAAEYGTGGQNPDRTSSRSALYRALRAERQARLRPVAKHVLPPLNPSA